MRTVAVPPSLPPPLLLLPPPQATNPIAATAVAKPNTASFRSFTLFPPVFDPDPNGIPSCTRPGLISPCSGQVKQFLVTANRWERDRRAPLPNRHIAWAVLYRSDQLLQSLRKSGWITAELGSTRSLISFGTRCVPKTAR